MYTKINSKNPYSTLNIFCLNYGSQKKNEAEPTVMEHIYFESVKCNKCINIISNTP